MGPVSAALRRGTRMGRIRKQWPSGAVATDRKGGKGDVFGEGAEHCTRGRVRSPIDDCWQSSGHFSREMGIRLSSPVPLNFDEFPTKTRKTQFWRNCFKPRKRRVHRNNALATKAGISAAPPGLEINFVRLNPQLKPWAIVGRLCRGVHSRIKSFLPKYAYKFRPNENAWPIRRPIP